MTAPGDRIVVIGAGRSPLVALLLDDRLDVTVVDVSTIALAALAEQLGAHPRRGSLHVVVGDVRTLGLDEPVDVWHDRATFHFLTDPDDQAAYAAAAGTAVRPGGHLVLAGFAPDGPTQCSGLPVARHDLRSLERLFGSQFELTGHERRDHRTPSGATQPFLHVVFRRPTRNELAPGGAALGS